MSAKEIENEENDRSDKQKVNQRGSQMEDDECPNPLRNTNLIRSPSELHSITQQSGGVFRENYMRPWRITRNENGVRIVSAVNLLFSVEAKVIFIAEDFSGLGSVIVVNSP